jgi:hypothetical protein
MAALVKAVNKEALVTFERDKMGRVVRESCNGESQMKDFFSGG